MRVSVIDETGRSRAAPRRIGVSRRRAIALAAAAVAALAWPALAPAAEADAPPVAVIRSFYAVLLGAMKDGPRLGFAGRRDRLAPIIRQTFDFPRMTRLMVGPQWTTIAPDLQQQLIDAFSNFSVATYANRFDDYSGERFEAEDEPVPVANGQVIVKTQLLLDKGDDKVDKVELDYLMQHDNARWTVTDIYLSGTVSELATRRSEFASVLRRDGPSALVDLLQKKAAALAG